MPATLRRACRRSRRAPAGRRGRDPPSRRSGGRRAQSIAQVLLQLLVGRHHQGTGVLARREEDVDHDHLAPQEVAVEPHRLAVLVLQRNVREVAMGRRDRLGPRVRDRLLGLIVGDLAHGVDRGPDRLDRGEAVDPPPRPSAIVAEQDQRRVARLVRGEDTEGPQESVDFLLLAGHERPVRGGAEFPGRGGEPLGGVVHRIDAHRDQPDPPFAQVARELAEVAPIGGQTPVHVVKMKLMATSRPRTRSE